MYSFKRVSKPFDRQGFTLLELSIVLVIIGLIAGGVIGGNALIQQTKFNSIISEANQYLTAVNTFYSKYDQLPGDFQEAQSYWPSCSDNASNTCNGNGDGHIGRNSAFNKKEGVRMWEHMARADIIPGDYDSSSAGAMNGYKGFPTDPYPMSALPSSKWDGGVWVGGYTSLTTTNNNNITGIALVQRGDATSISTQAPFTQQQAESLDRKMDDGLPSSGKVRGLHWHSGTTTCTSGSSYRVSANVSACAILMQIRK